MAIVCNNSSLHYEYFCIRSIEWLLSIPIGISLQSTQSYKFLPKIDIIPVTYREYYNLLLARAQLVGRLLLDWRTQKALEFENENRQFTKEEIFKSDQMVYLFALHSSALQTSTIKFRQDFIGLQFLEIVSLGSVHYLLVSHLLVCGASHSFQ